MDFAQVLQILLSLSNFSQQLQYICASQLNRKFDFGRQKGNLKLLNTSDWISDTWDSSYKVKDFKDLVIHRYKKNMF